STASSTSCARRGGPSCWPRIRWSGFRGSATARSCSTRVGRSGRDRHPSFPSPSNASRRPASGRWRDEGSRGSLLQGSPPGLARPGAGHGRGGLRSHAAPSAQLRGRPQRPDASPARRGLSLGGPALLLHPCPDRELPPGAREPGDRGDAPSRGAPRRDLLRQGAGQLVAALRPGPAASAGDGGPLRSLAGRDRRGDRRARARDGGPLRAGYAPCRAFLADARPAGSSSPAPLSAGRPRAHRRGTCDLAASARRSDGAGKILGASVVGIRWGFLASLRAAVRTRDRGVRMEIASAPPVSPRAVRGALVALGVGILLLAVGWYQGLFVAPPEHYMGEVQRIMYVHVPTAWNAMLALSFAFLSALAFLWKNDWRWDARLEAAVEMGVLLSFLLCVRGAIWAKPTWGVWWDWDPRLTTTAVMLVAFVGILALRHLVDDPRKRAVWSSVATVISYASVPIVYFSVRWWNSLHQVQ